VVCAPRGADDAGAGDVPARARAAGAGADRPFLDTRTLAARGALWKAASQSATQIIAFGVALALARLLTPTEYGTAAMVLAISALGAIFTDITLTSGLVQREHVGDADKSAVFWLNIALGAAATAVMFLAADGLARFYDDAGVSSLFRALSPIFVVNALGAVPRAVLVRAMRFKEVELQLTVATLVAGLLGVSLAALGYGAWALVAVQLCTAAVSTCAVWLLSPIRLERPSRSRAVRELARSGGHVFATRLFSYAGANFDNILIGRSLGARALGPYAFSYNIMLSPLQRVAVPAQELLFPTLSRLRGDRVRLLHAWVSATRLVLAVVVPPLILVVVQAHDVVHVLLGNRWADAAPILQALACAGLIQLLGRVNTAVFQALGRTRAMLRWTMFATALNIAGFVIGVNRGALGVAVAFALTNLLAQPVNLVLAARAVGVSVGRFCSEFVRIGRAFGVLAVSAVVLHGLLGWAGGPAALRILVVSGGALAAYVATLVLHVADVRGDIKLLTPRATRSDEAPAALGSAALAYGERGVDP
jgi:O-antigen/teichoic acid export membrane protein